MNFASIKIVRECTLRCQNHHFDTTNIDLTTQSVWFNFVFDFFFFGSSVRFCLFINVEAAKESFFSRFSSYSWRDQHVWSLLLRRNVHQCSTADICSDEPPDRKMSSKKRNEKKNFVFICFWFSFHSFFLSSFSLPIEAIPFRNSYSHHWRSNRGRVTSDEENKIPFEKCVIESCNAMNFSCRRKFWASPILLVVFDASFIGSLNSSENILCKQDGKFWLKISKIESCCRERERESTQENDYNFDVRPTTQKTEQPNETKNRTKSTTS